MDKSHKTAEPLNIPVSDEDLRAMNDALVPEKGGTQLDARDMERMGKRQVMRVSLPNAHHLQLRQLSIDARFDREILASFPYLDLP